jgi:hypothetical protein
MTVWLIWVAVLAIGLAWFALIGLLCRQIVAGKWEADYWPPDPYQNAEPLRLEDLKEDLEREPGMSVVRVRFNREGGFNEF